MQPRASEELVVERIQSADDNEEELLPSVLAPEEESSDADRPGHGRVRGTGPRGGRAASTATDLRSVRGDRDPVRRGRGQRCAAASGRASRPAVARVAPGQGPVLVPRGLPGPGQGAAVGLPRAYRPGTAHRPADGRGAADDHPGTIQALPRSFLAPAFPGPGRPSGDGTGETLRHRRHQPVRGADGLLAAMAKRRAGGAAHRKGPQGLLEDYLGEALDRCRLSGGPPRSPCWRRW